MSPRSMLQSHQEFADFVNFNNISTLSVIHGTRQLKLTDNIKMIFDNPSPMKHDETIFDKFPGTLLHPRKVLQLVARNICFAYMCTIET